MALLESEDWTKLLELGNLRKIGLDHDRIRWELYDLRMELYVFSGELGSKQIDAKTPILLVGDSRTTLQDWEPLAANLWDEGCSAVFATYVDFAEGLDTCHSKVQQAIEHILLKLGLSKLTLMGRGMTGHLVRSVVAASPSQIHSFLVVSLPKSSKSDNSDELKFDTLNRIFDSEDVAGLIPLSEIMEDVLAITPSVHIMGGRGNRLGPWETAATEETVTFVVPSKAGGVLKSAETATVVKGLMREKHVGIHIWLASLTVSVDAEKEIEAIGAHLSSQGRRYPIKGEIALAPGLRHVAVELEKAACVLCKHDGTLDVEVIASKASKDPVVVVPITVGDLEVGTPKLVKAETSDGCDAELVFLRVF